MNREEPSHASLAFTPVSRGGVEFRSSSRDQVCPENQRGKRGREEVGFLKIFKPVINKEEVRQGGEKVNERLPSTIDFVLTVDCLELSR